MTPLLDPDDLETIASPRTVVLYLMELELTIPREVEDEQAAKEKAAAKAAADEIALDPIEAGYLESLADVPPPYSLANDEQSNGSSGSQGGGDRVLPVVNAATFAGASCCASQPPACLTDFFFPPLPVARPPPIRHRRAALTKREQEQARALAGSVEKVVKLQHSLAAAREELDVTAARVGSANAEMERLHAEERRAVTAMEAAEERAKGLREENDMLTKVRRCLRD